MLILKVIIYRTYDTNRNMKNMQKDVSYAVLNDPVHPFDITDIDVFEEGIYVVVVCMKFHSPVPDTIFGHNFLNKISLFRVCSCQVINVLISQVRCIESYQRAMFNGTSETSGSGVPFQHLFAAHDRHMRETPPVDDNETGRK